MVGEDVAEDVILIDVVVVVFRSKELKDKKTGLCTKVDYILLFVCPEADRLPTEEVTETPVLPSA